MKATSTNLEERLLRAVRKNCVDCSGGRKRDAEHCDVEECPFYGFRGAAGFAGEISGMRKQEAQNPNEKGVSGGESFKELILEGGTVFPEGGIIHRAIETNQEA